MLIVAAIIALRLRRAARRHRTCPKASAANTLDDPGRRPPVLLAVPLPGRPGVDRHDGRPGRRRSSTLTVIGADVIHGWWVPALGGQIDAIPGRTNHTWFQAEQDRRTYDGQLHAALRDRSTRTCRRTVKVVDAAGVPTLPRLARAGQRDGRRRGVRRRLLEVPRHERHRATTARRSRTGRSTPATSTNLLRNGRRTRCRRSAATWTDAQIAAMIRYLQKTKGGATRGH